MSVDVDSDGCVFTAWISVCKKLSASSSVWLAFVNYRNSESGLMQRACPFVRLSVCLSVCRQKAIFSKTKQFRATPKVQDGRDAIF